MMRLTPLAPAKSGRSAAPCADKTTPRVGCEKLRDRAELAAASHRATRDVRDGRIGLARRS
eukprot:4240077-Lingulodinium_polyedra.AAC.1